jgi:hypothetical protein
MSLTVVIVIGKKKMPLLSYVVVTVLSSVEVTL